MAHTRYVYFGVHGTLVSRGSLTKDWSRRRQRRAKQRIQREMLEHLEVEREEQWGSLYDLINEYYDQSEWEKYESRDDGTSYDDIYYDDHYDDRDYVSYPVIDLSERIARLERELADARRTIYDLTRMIS